ncbi:CoA transferase [Paludibacterium yongneupense]|uniref:CoA transferase n=1 Tax=Paludibacterium yongneupense TaxID=400061 RepID=UPI0004131ADD|nr:CoA transferase [Paludibacterium yongneupense]
MIESITQGASGLPYGLNEIWSALQGAPARLGLCMQSGRGALPSALATTDLACSSIAAAGLALSEYAAAGGAAAARVVVDRRLASLWFASSLRPQGWSMAPAWDPLAGDYESADGWIRLHTNAPHHRAAVLAVLGLGDRAGREDVARAVARQDAEELEAALVAHGACAARMRSSEAWLAHAQGRAVAAEPLLHYAVGEEGAAAPCEIARARPLRAIRVLDLTRIIAGPVATRFLAGYGADVLRIDPLLWDEPGTEQEMTLGKRCARLDLKSRAGRETFERLLSRADVLVHGYRSDALEALGLGAERRRRLRPGLIDVSLDAYGWSGPWRERRGFDSLVQMSSGIAETGMRAFGRERPTPLPVQALDHACGYVLAAAVLRGLDLRRRAGTGSMWRTSLARMAQLLLTLPAGAPGAPALAPETPDDVCPGGEATAWGPARRLVAPLTVSASPLYWERPASALGTDPARW